MAVCTGNITFSMSAVITANARHFNTNLQECLRDRMCDYSADNNRRAMAVKQQ